MCILGPRSDCCALNAKYCMVVDNLACCEGDGVFSRIIGKVFEVECDIKLRYKFLAKVFLSYSFYIKILVWPGEIGPRLNAILTLMSYLRPRAPPSPCCRRWCSSANFFNRRIQETLQVNSQIICVVPNYALVVLNKSAA